MRSIVKSSWLALNRPLEGRVPVMYPDKLGLVTCAVGVLIDPIGYALRLPWVHTGPQRTFGPPATLEEIKTEWFRVKNTPNGGKLATKHWLDTARLVLTDKAIDDIVMLRLVQDDLVLATRFSQWEAWPAYAQAATLSMAWAMGPYFAYPNWQEAAERLDWTGCAKECYIPDATNPGLVPRNAMNLEFFHAAVHSDPDALVWN